MGSGERIDLVSNTKQNYVSDELTHFVGKDLSEPKQFDTFVKILQEQALTHPPHNLNESGNLSGNMDASLCQNEMFVPQTVCFCDIPLDHLDLHMAKYSKFGIAFPKRVLLKQGVNPVLYVPMHSVVGLVNGAPALSRALLERLNNEFLGDQFTESLRCEHLEVSAREYSQMIASFRDTLRPKPRDLERLSEIAEHPTPESDRERREVMDNMQRSWDRERELQPVMHRNEFFIKFGLMSFVKVFDDRLPDDHLDNYYMEREWRVIGNVVFETAHVSRVILPAEYGARFRDELPQYAQVDVHWV